MRVSFTHINAAMPLFCDSIGYDWQQMFVSRPAGHQFYHWLQSDAGTGIFNVRDKKYILAPGQGLLIRPHVPHHYRPQTLGEPWETEFIAFGGTLVDALADFLDLDDALYYPQLNVPQKTFIRSQYPLFAHDNVRASLDQSASLYQFLMRLKSHPQSNFSDMVDKKQVAGTIATAIMTHYAEKLTATDLMAVSGYSRSYQSKLFRAYYGLSPLQYLADYRLRQAKAMLMAHPTMQVQTVAEESGFADVSHFIQLFKENAGMTPFAFKNQFLKAKK